MIEITTKLLPTNTKRRSGLKLARVAFLVAHDTANDGATALNNVNYYINSANEVNASAHFFVDDKQILNCIPENEKAWHVHYGAPLDNQLYDGDANDCALGIELCYSTKGVFDSKKAYQNYVELFAYLCKKYSLDPMKHIIGHYRLDPTRRSDPINAFMKIGKTWEQFLQDVSNILKPQGEIMVNIPVPQSKVDKVLAYLKTI